jgi:hypothetical protein
LGAWVINQRYYYQNFRWGRDAPITEARIAQLNSIGFEWSLKGRDTWQHNFELLCAFQRKNGHCQVPKGYTVDSVRLGSWVSRQRRYYRNFIQGKASPITEERISQLNSIGFERRPTGLLKDDCLWQHKFELLCAFQRKSGHCRVPQSYTVDSVRLGLWVKHQRHFYQNYKRGMKRKGTSITEERIAQLNSIGFEWKLRAPPKDDSTWQHKFERLCAFQRENGHCRVPKGYTVDSVRLGVWVSRQRYYYQNYKNGMKGEGASITEERITQLTSIGFDWMPRTGAGVTR